VNGVTALQLVAAATLLLNSKATGRATGNRTSAGSNARTPSSAPCWQGQRLGLQSIRHQRLHLRRVVQPDHRQHTDPERPVAHRNEFKGLASSHLVTETLPTTEFVTDAGRRADGRAALRDQMISAFNQLGLPRWRRPHDHDTVARAGLGRRLERLGQWRAGFADAAGLPTTDSSSPESTTLPA